MKKVFGLLIIGLVILMASCSNNNEDSTATLMLNINGLEDLGSNYVYEGWIIVNNSPVSTGTFTSTAANQSFSVDATQLKNATKFVLTIEPAGETGTAADTPSDTKFLSGDFSGDSASLSVGIVGDFNNSDTGSFFLRSPTDETDSNNGNDENGIWFGTPGTPPSPSLSLPVLGTGWKYEGWVVVDGVGPVSTGTFTAFDTADDNAGTAASFGGTENSGPPIPGEDFLNNAPAGFTFPLDIRGRTVVISVEPSPDNSPAPFTLKPLIGTAGNDTAPTTYTLNFSDSSFPTGTANR